MENQQFLLYFYLPMVIWLVMMVILFFFLLKKYTLGTWTAEKPNPYEKETLALPRGIFRGLLTLTLLFGVIVFELALIMLNRPESYMSEFMVAFQMMIAFYFGSKVMHQAVSSDRKKAHDSSMQAVEMARVGSSTIYPTSGGGVGKTSNSVSVNDSENSFYDPESEG